MLEQAIWDVYTKFKLHFYLQVFDRFQNREASLTTVETYCMETIQALGQPTINEFATFAKISQPNAAYKVEMCIRDSVCPGRQPALKGGDCVFDRSDENHE